MAVPKKRTTKTRRDQRRSHHALTAVPLTKCANCGAPSRPHTVCAQCGQYRGRQITKAAA